MNPTRCTDCGHEVIELLGELLESMPTIPVAKVDRHVVLFYDDQGHTQVAELGAILDSEGAAPAIYRRHSCAEPSLRERMERLGREVTA